MLLSNRADRSEYPKEVVDVLADCNIISRFEFSKAKGTTLRGMVLSLARDLAENGEMKTNNLIHVLVGLTYVFDEEPVFIEENESECQNNKETKMH